MINGLLAIRNALRRQLTPRTSGLLLVFLICMTSCSRGTYQRWADRDAYRLINSREFDPRWQLPDRPVQPNPHSRLADNYDPNCEPLPFDDPASRCYMLHPYHSKTVKYWLKKGAGVPIDQLNWLDFLPRTESGELELSKQSSVDVALINSREYQDQVEQLFLVALSLSGNRHEFELQWAGGNRTDFASTGDGMAAVRDLSTANDLGFSRNLATGGQFITNLANSFVWQLGGSPSDAVTGNLLISLTQPLLRGAFRFVRTEALTQSERDLLYAVRDFAHFRRQFYLDVVSQYLGLLNLVEAVRIEKENLRVLERNLTEYRVKLEMQQVSTVQVDQVYQSYLQGRFAVLSAEQSLQSALDNFKFQLGLPALVPSQLDEQILKPFELNSPELEQLQKQVEQLDQSLTEYLPPEPAPIAFLLNAHDELIKLIEEIQKIKPQIDQEIAQWRGRLNETKSSESGNQDEKLEFDRQLELADQIEQSLKELDDNLPQDLAAAKAARKQLDAQAELDAGQAVDAWKRLQSLIGRELGDQIATLFTAQTLIRLFLIELVPLEVDPDAAVTVALENRLELMNERARVVDAYRQLEIAANQLKSDLDVAVSADLRTDPTRKNPIRFDGDENLYNFSVEFDGPLERVAERNLYRSAQLAFQQQRRTFMRAEDLIVIQIRDDLRQLNLNRFNFENSRQQLISASRQVEETQFQLRGPNPEGSSLTLDLLQALQGLRNAKNSLISSWVNYEVSRIRLFVDLELLMLDENGVWINEYENPIDESTDAIGGVQPNNDADRANDQRSSQAPSSVPPADAPGTDLNLSSRRTGGGDLGVNQ